MDVAVITFGRCGSSQLIELLKQKKIRVVGKPNNHSYPHELKNKLKENGKVIFLLRDVQYIITSILAKDATWIKNHYKNLHSDYKDFKDITKRDTLNYKKLYDEHMYNSPYETLFLKYENLYGGDKETQEALNSFLGTTIDIKFSKNNKWASKYNNLVDIDRSNFEDFGSSYNYYLKLK